MGRTEDEIRLRDEAADCYDDWYNERGANAVYVEDRSILGHLQVTDADKHLLDAGCGTGRLTYQLAVKHPGLQIHALDISEKSLSVLKAKDASNIKTGVFDFSNDNADNYDHNYFDKILSVQMIQHLDKNGALHCIRQLYDMLAPDGILVCELFNYNGLNRWLERVRRRRNGNTRTDHKCTEDGLFFEYRYTASEFKQFVLKNTKFRSAKIFGCSNFSRRFVNRIGLLSHLDLFLSRFSLSSKLGYYFICVCRK